MYSLSQHVNVNKIFLVQFSELEKRLDPLYYYEILNNKVNFNCASSPFSKIAKTYSGGTPSKDKPEYWNGNILWASPKDMKNFYLSDTEDKITELGLKNSATILAPKGSLLIVFRSGILQHTLPVAITEKDTAINQDLKVVIPVNEIIPEFLAVYFRVFQNRILPRIVKHSTTVQSINQEELNSLPIPIPDKQTQKQIIAINQEAIEHKNQSEAAAEKLLSSIDDYLLRELGINMPSKNTVNEPVGWKGFKLNKHNPLVKSGRLFLAAAREIENRIDPEYYRLFYCVLFDEIKNVSHCRLKDVTQLIDYGLMPTQDYAKDENSGIPFIRVTNILASGEIDMSNTKYIPFDTPRVDQKRVKENDILMVQCGSTTGKVAVVPKEYENYLANSFSFIIRSNEKIRQDFLFYILSSPIVQMQIVRSQNIVTVRPNTSKPAVENLLIPLPPLEKQIEIAQHISEIRQQAQLLQKEATQALQQAKEKIEKMILG